MAKKSKKKHPSLSEVQEEAEREVFESLKEMPGYKSLERRRVPIGENGAHCRPDGVTQANRRMIEIYAWVGSLHGAQNKKVAADILKFATIRQQPGLENTRCEIYFVDEDALASVRGWVKEAADQFGVELKVAEDFPESLRERLEATQDDRAKGAKKKGKRKKK